MAAASEVAVASVGVADSSAAPAPVVVVPVADKSVAVEQSPAAAVDGVLMLVETVDTAVVEPEGAVVAAAVELVVDVVVAVELVELGLPAFSSSSYRYYEQAAGVAALMSMRRYIPRMTWQIDTEILLISSPFVVIF